MTEMNREIQTVKSYIPQGSKDFSGHEDEIVSPYEQKNTPMREIKFIIKLFHIWGKKCSCKNYCVLMFISSKGECAESIQK